MDSDNILKQALDLSDQILIAIDSQDLERVASLDEQRRSIIDSYFKENVTIDANLTHKLKQKNDQIISQLTQMQQKTRSQQLNLNKSQQASKAYLANT